MENKETTFYLKFDDLQIGVLSFSNNMWEFRYSDEFKELKGIKTLADFPDENKIYRSEELWPFFSSRIPSLARSRVKKTVEQEGIEPNDLLGLLTRFGKRTITNPFELHSVE